MTSRDDHICHAGCYAQLTHIGSFSTVEYDCPPERSRFRIESRKNKVWSSSVLVNVGSLYYGCSRLRLANPLGPVVLLDLQQPHR